MQDELNGQLLRLFSDSERPLADAHFVAQISERLSPLQGSAGERLRSILVTAVSGTARGLASPWRLWQATLLGAAAAALWLWAILV